MTEKNPAPAKPRHTFIRGAPAWKKILLVAAAALFVVGLGIKGMSMVGGRSGATASSAGGPGSTSLIDIRTGGPTVNGSGGQQQPAGDDWSPVFINLGFGFFAGYCMGYALRAFFKVSAIAIGIILLAMFGLAKAGVVQVDWGAIESGFNNVVAWIKPELESFKSFVAGSIPSAGSAAVGFFAAFKRH